MQIIVRDNNVDQALRALKKKLQREGVYREMKLRRHYEKPSEKRARERAAASASTSRPSHSFSTAPRLSGRIGTAVTDIVFPQNETGADVYRRPSSKPS